MSAFGEYTSNSYGRSNGHYNRPNYVGFNYDVYDSEYSDSNSTEPNYVGFYPLGGGPAYSSSAPKFSSRGGIGEAYPREELVYPPSDFPLGVPARSTQKHRGLFEKEEDTVVCHHNPYGGLFGDDKLSSVFDEGYKAGYLEAKRKYDN